MFTSSKQGFVEYFRRDIQCSPGRHIVSADPVTQACDCEATVRAKMTDLDLTAIFIRVLVNETRG